MKKIVTLTMAIMALVATVPTNVYAAESKEQVKLAYEEEADIEEIDPNIVVVITEIDEEDEGISPCHIVGNHTTFDFHGSLTGKYRDYHGNHFSVDLTTSSDQNGNFTLKLQREGFLGAGVTVAKAELPQNGSFHVEFLNINNPNRYRFRFEQTGMFVNAHQVGRMDIWDWD